MKTTAWADRHAARDLFDLYGLARHGAVDAEALGLYLRHGPTGRPPADWLFDEPPTEQEWRDQLGGQTRLSVGSAEAAAVVRDAWADALSRDQHPQVQFHPDDVDAWIARSDEESEAARKRFSD